MINNADKERNKNESGGKQERAVLKTDKKNKKHNESNRSEKIKGHYGRTFYYSFLTAFIVFGLIAVFIFIYTQDKNFFGFSQRYYDRAVTYLEKGEVDAAQKELEACLNFDEKYTRARTLLADIYIQNGKYSEAETLLSRSIELSPRNVDSYLEYIKVLALQGKFDYVFSFIDNISSSYMLMKVQEKLPSVPSVSPSPGNYDSEIKIEISTDESCKVYYTTDGSVPNFESNVYDGNPIVLSKNSMTLRAVSVNENGYISNEFNSVFSVYNSNTEYKFADPKVEALIRAMINKPKGAVLYGDLEAITAFSNATAETSAVEGQIKTLEDLSAIPNLTTVIIRNETGISDFSSLSLLTNVKSLDLTGCKIGSKALTEISSMSWLENLVLDKNSVSDTEPISKLIKLKTLSLSDNSIKDITALSGLSNLTELTLSKNFIQDISPISSMTRLKTLNLSDNLITSVSPISELTSLKEVNLSGNQISSVEALRRLTTFTTLNLSDNTVSNISALSGMSSLVNLNISSNSVSSLSALSELKNLTTLNVGGNKASDFDTLTGTNIKYLTASNMNLNDAALAKIAKLSKLQTLDVRNNQIVDVSPLTALASLTTLTVSGNYPKNLSVLASCKKLSTVNCANTTVSDADIYALKNKGITVITD